MTAPKPSQVGDLIDVADGTVIRRPNGTEHTVSGQTYVLDIPGTFTVGDREVKVE